MFHAPERPELLFSGEERPQLDSWLEFCRATLLYKCDGLELEQLEVRPVAGSALSLLGIIRHMTYVEQAWFERIFTGRDVTTTLAGFRPSRVAVTWIAPASSVERTATRLMPSSILR